MTMAPLEKGIKEVLIIPVLQTKLSLLLAEVTSDLRFTRKSTKINLVATISNS